MPAITNNPDEQGRRNASFLTEGRKIRDEQIAAARSIDLLTYLQVHDPSNIKKCGHNRYCLRDHDSLTISNGKRFWFSRGFGSNNALDYLIQVRGMDFKDAVRSLAGNITASYELSASHRHFTKDKLPPLFLLLVPNHDNYRVTAYLMGRGISREIIDHCIREKSLYESKKHHSCVFTGKNSKGKYRFACERSITGDYRKDTTGSDKGFSFSIQARSSAQSVLNVFEAPVDLLSYATIRHEHSSKLWNTAHYLSLGGTSDKALVQYLKDHPSIRCVNLCLDNDRAGHMAAARIRKSLEAKGYIVTNTPPPSGKDYNRHLQKIRQEQKQIGRSSKDAAITI